MFLSLFARRLVAGWPWWRSELGLLLALIVPDAEDAIESAGDDRLAVGAGGDRVHVLGGAAENRAGSLPFVALMNRTLASPPLATTMSSATKLTLVTSLVNWFCTVRSWSPVRVSQTLSTMSAPLETSIRPSARHATPST